MTWVKLDDAFWANPKVVSVGNEAAGAYARMLSYCGQHLTDGVVDASVAKFITRAAVCTQLVAHGFLAKQGSGFSIPDFLDFNPSREEVEAKRNARSRAGKKGGVASGKRRNKP